jgi:hypothetical protein
MTYYLKRKGSKGMRSLLKKERNKHKSGELFTRFYELFLIDHSAGKGSMMKQLMNFGPV